MGRLIYHTGINVYDGERMEEDGFIFESEVAAAAETEEPFVDKITYDPIYDDENQDYIKQSIEEI